MKRRLVVLLFVLCILLISGCGSKLCGDGVCHNREERKGSCSEDCEITPILSET